MMLPGNPDGDAARLMCKGHDLSVWGQSRCSSLRTGRPSTWRRAAVQGAVGIPWMRSSRLLPLMARTSIGPHREKSVCKDSLGGKAGCGESRPSGLEGGSRKPESLDVHRAASRRCGPYDQASRKTLTAPSFYPYSVNTPWPWPCLPSGHRHLAHNPHWGPPTSRDRTRADTDYSPRTGSRHVPLRNQHPDARLALARVARDCLAGDMRRLRSAPYAARGGDRCVTDDRGRGHPGGGSPALFAVPRM
jgi:hypothetical protein